MCSRQFFFNLEYLNFLGKKRSLNILILKRGFLAAPKTTNFLSTYKTFGENLGVCSRAVRILVVNDIVAEIV